MGMYETTTYMDIEVLIQECVALLSCPEWLEEAMKFVAFSWHTSAKQHLTNTHRNRQAACCFTHGAPEYVTKLAWNRLNKTQMLTANKIADEIIETFESLLLNAQLYEDKIKSKCFQISTRTN